MPISNPGCVSLLGITTLITPHLYIKNIANIQWAYYLTELGDQRKQTVNMGGRIVIDDNAKEIWCKEWREHKEYAEERFKYSVGKANDVIRQLTLAGIAVVWVFRETAADVQFKLSSGLRIAAILFIITLVLDFAYWVVGFVVANRQLNKIKPDEATAVAAGKEWPLEVSGPPPDIPDGPLNFLFVAKATCLVAGSIVLLYNLSLKM